MKNVIIGYYHVEGYGVDTAETELVGHPSEMYAKMLTIMRKRHPGLHEKAIVRTGSRVETRDETNPGFIELFPGMTIRQIFEGAEGSARKIGQVFFQSDPFEIMLILSAATGKVSLRLHPLMSHSGVVSFSNQIDPQVEASNLVKIVTGILGNDARDLKLSIREKI